MPIKPTLSTQSSLRSHLLISSSVWLLLITFAAGYIVPSFIKDYLVEQEKHQLYLYLDELTALVDVDATGKLSLPQKISNPRFQQPYSGLYWSLSVNNTQIRSRSLWDTKITGDEDSGFQGPNEQSLLTVKREFYLPEVDEPVELTIAANQDQLLNTLHQLTKSFWVILAIMSGGILMLITLQVSWSLWPLLRLQTKLKQVRNGEEKELSGSYPKEIRPVVDDLNALLFHYQEILERARNHAGNLSHALKTPIAVLNNDVEQLPEPAQSKLQPTLQQLQQQIEYHLGRARMAGAANILAAKTAPSARVDAISMAMDKVYAHRDVVLVNELDSELIVAIEKRDLDEIIGNVIENGYKWANNLVRIHQIDGDKKTIKLLIEDDGPGIDSAAYESAIKRGVRLDETTPGTGLGLNIVSELAHSYRGGLKLSKSTLGGLCVELTLPLPRE
ncbi:ATP-binding protein [Photobacterium makurazakiensis]|uniref:ATP-binding protein n=1 Tax=Photobacterium makurazakiensis TaxID=2910234 RepID=UPI003D0FE7AF